jgi:hypothetical protein
MYRGAGLALTRTSVGGEFNDSIILSSPSAVVDVPTVSDSWGWGVFWAAHELPASGLASGAEIGFSRGAMSAPGVLAPPGGYAASHWNLYVDGLGAWWIPVPRSATSTIRVSLAARLGLGYQHLRIADSAFDGLSLLDASYGGLRLRYGAGLRVRLGGSARPLLASVEWLWNKGGYSSVSAGGESIELAESLAGDTSELRIGLAFLFLPPPGSVNEKGPKEAGP